MIKLNKMYYTKEDGGEKAMDMKDLEPKGEQPVNKLSILTFILLFFTIVTIIFFVYVKSQNIDIKSFSIKDFVKSIFQVSNQNHKATVTSEFKYDFKEHSFFSVYKDNIIKCTTDSFVWLDRQGQEQKVAAISTDNPVVKMAGEYILVADIGGKNFYIIKGQNIVWSQTCDSTIINADISSQGFVSVVKEKKGYKGAIDIYDNYGSLVFTTVRGGAFIISSKVLSSEDKVLINSVDTSGINANTYLELVNLHAEIVGKLLEDDEIFPSLWDLNGKYILGVSDNTLICYDMGLKRKWKKVYSKIFSSNIALGKYLVVAAQSESKSGFVNRNKSDVIIINTKGEEVSTYSLNSKVTNIESYGNIIAVNTGIEINFINTGGKLIGSYTSKSDIMGVHFFSRQEALVQTQNSIVVLKF